MKRVRGFSMIEMVVVLAVIAILASVMIPIVTSYIDRAKVNAANSDVKRIVTAITQFNSDTTVWPIYTSTSFGSAFDVNGTAFLALRTPGNDAIIPSDGDGHDWPPVTAEDGTIGDLDAILNKNSMGLPITGPRAWKGAYLDLGEDPWGTGYYLNAQFLKPGSTSQHGTIDDASPSAVFIISAGPNQTLDTNYDQPTSNFKVGGDDIVVRIK